MTIGEEMYLNQNKTGIPDGMGWDDRNECYQEVKLLQMFC